MSGVLRGMPRPEPSLDSAPFWDGCQRDEFLIQRCSECGSFRWPPGPMCFNCQSTEADWVAASGHGHVYSWVVVTYPVHTVLNDQVPYVVALVELEEGIRVIGNVTGCEVTAIRADMKVQLYFATRHDGLRLPNFRST